MLGLLTKVTDNNALALNNLLSNTILVDLAEANPLTELLSAGNLQELDLVLGAEGLNQAEVLLLLAGLGKDTEMGLAAVEGLDALTKTTGKAIVVEGATEDFDQGGLGGDLANDGDNGLLSNNNISFC